MFCKSAYTSVQPEPLKGTIRDRHVAWPGLRWTLWRQVGLGLPDENAAAYGEIVWSWRRDPGATLLVSPGKQRGQERPLPGEITYKP